MAGALTIVRSTMPLEEDPEARRRGRRTGAILLVLLVSIGSVKATPLFSLLPVDPTLLIAFLIFLTSLNALVIVVAQREKLPMSWLLAATGVWGLGLFQFTASEHASSKTFALATLTLGCAFAGSLLLTRTARQRDAFYSATLVVSLLVAVLLLLTPANDPDLGDRLALEGTNTIGPARVIAAGLVVLLVWTMSGRIQPIVGMSIGVPLLALLVSTGTRGPLAALAVATLAVLPFVGARARRRAILTLILAVAAGWHSLSNAPTGVRGRFLLLFSDDQGDSVLVRQELWNATINSIASAPLGRGWGGLEPVLNPYGTYPHNIVLEVAAEAGLIAGLILVAAVVLAARRLSSAVRAGEPGALVGLALLVYWLANAFVSGDLNSNRGVIALLALAANSRHVTAFPPPSSRRHRQGKRPGDHPTANPRHTRTAKR